MRDLRFFEKSFIRGKKGESYRREVSSILREESRCNNRTILMIDVELKIGLLFDLREIHLENFDGRLISSIYLLSIIVSSAKIVSFECLD